MLNGGATSSMLAQSVACVGTSLIRILNVSLRQGHVPSYPKAADPYLKEKQP